MVGKLTSNEHSFFSNVSGIRIFIEPHSLFATNVNQVFQCITFCNLLNECFAFFLQFNSQLFEHFNQQVDEVLKEVTADPLHNKELLGIERRLSDLEKRCNEAMRIAEEQNDVTQVRPRVKYIWKR